MLRRCLIVVAVIGLMASPALAQSRVEVSGMFGYTFSEGVNLTNTVPTILGTYNRVDPKSSFSYGFTFGGYVTEQAEIEFLFSHQTSTLEVSGGTGPLLSGDMSVFNYQGNFIYNFGAEDMKTRPYIFIGLGASQFGDATFPARVVPGTTKFSWAIGGGVKYFASPHVGVKAQVRWVPTYIKSNTAGWWCDPYWGCGAVGNPNYANFFEIAGGIVARF